MARTATARAGVAILATLASSLLAQSTASESAIEARRALMVELERLMKPIDSFTAEASADVEAVKSTALSIHALLLATPHLFPPTTNRFDPAAAEPVTLALPAIWEQWSSFMQFNTASTTAAAGLAVASGIERARAAAAALRGSCDACHTLFMRPYIPSTATDADRDFDFDSVLPQ
jgi:cytochrome c556